MQARVLVVAGLAGVVAAVVACSAASTAVEPIVSGTYATTVVDGTNPCQISGIVQGTSTPGVPLVVVQEAGAPQVMSVVLGGAPGVTAQGALGTNVFTGVFGPTQVALVPQVSDAGAPTVDSGGCTFTPGAALNLTFTGNTVQGSLLYTVDVTGGSCASLIGCQTIEVIAGALIGTSSGDAGGSSDGAAGDAASVGADGSSRNEG